MIPFNPLEVNEHIEKLLDLIDSEFDPEIIPVRNEPNAKLHNCYLNVDEKVKRDGGKVHYGWAIFQSKIICEAERHAIWESPNGEFIDITPREFKFEEIMFVFDNDFIYTGQLIDNIRVNVTTNTTIDDFIKLCETLEKFYTYGVRIDDEQMIVPEPAMTFIKQYENLKLQFQLFLAQGGAPESHCLCGEKIKYKNCHGKPIKARFINDLMTVKKALKK